MGREARRKRDPPCIRIATIVASLDILLVINPSFSVLIFCKAVIFVKYFECVTTPNTHFHRQTQSWGLALPPRASPPSSLSQQKHNPSSSSGWPACERGEQRREGRGKGEGEREGGKGRGRGRG